MELVTLELITGIVGAITGICSIGIIFYLTRRTNKQKREEKIKEMMDVICDVGQIYLGVMRIIRLEYNDDDMIEDPNLSEVYMGIHRRLQEYMYEKQETICSLIEKHKSHTNNSNDPTVREISYRLDQTVDLLIWLKEKFMDNMKLDRLDKLDMVESSINFISEEIDEDEMIWKKYYQSFDTNMNEMAQIMDYVKDYSTDAPTSKSKN